MQQPAGRNVRNAVIRLDSGDTMSARLVASRRAGQEVALLNDGRILLPSAFEVIAYFDEPASAAS